MSSRQLATMVTQVYMY